VRTRGIAVSVAAVAVLGGCGSGTKHGVPPPPRLPAALGARLASESEAVAQLLDRSDGCGALAAARRLQQDSSAAINAGRVPARFQEPLAAAANDLVFRIHCAPVVAPRAAPQEPHGKSHGEGKGHGKHKHGHHGGEGE
jgi:hypothetical protein